MSTNSPLISIGNFVATVATPTISLVSATEAVSIPFTFSANTYVSKAVGSYTFNNDNPVAVTFGSSQPSWLIVSADTQLNFYLSPTNGAYPNLYMTTNKLAFFTVGVTPAAGYQYLILDGRTSGTNYPFGNAATTGTTVNYAIYWGNGSIS